MSGATADTIFLVGNPNVGKSVIFNLLTTSYAVVSNYPGTTVELTRGRLRGLGRRPEVVDTPGINSLTPLSLDEIVTRDILLNQRGTVVQVVDARNLPRGLRITIELSELGLPVVLALNMVDEATAAGLEISPAKLSELLGVPVVPTVAVERRGISELFQALHRPAVPKLKVDYPDDIEAAVSEICSLLPDLPVSCRGVALMVLSGDEGILQWLAERTDEKTIARLREIRDRLQRRYSDPLDFIIAQHRWRLAEQIADTVTARRPVPPSRLRSALSAATMHPVLGPLILLAVLYTMYLVVGKIGAGLVVDWFSSSVIGSPAQPVMALGDKDCPATVQASGQVTIRAAGRSVTITSRRATQKMRIIIGPGFGCPRFLREQTSYSIAGNLFVNGPSIPLGHVILTYPDNKRQVEDIALVPFASRGSYSIQASFQPERDGARYLIEITVPAAQEVKISDLALRRDPEGIVNPWLARIVNTYVPTDFLRQVLVGRYGVITMGLTLAIGVVLPIVAFFFAFFAILEDSGYLARLTVLANRPLSIMGLTGRAIVPLVLGLGCDTMATLASRILESPRSRTIVVFLLALGVPCSAQLGVIMAMAGSIGPAALAIVFGVVLAQLFVMGYLASRLLPGHREDFLVEIPLLRLPRLANVLLKTARRVEWFLREAMPYFLIGTAAIAIADYTGLLAAIERVLEPVIVHLLSLPRQATYAFLVGFLRRDYGAAGLFDLAYEGALDHTQIVVALVTMTLFVPCIANFLVMIREQGIKRAFAMVAIIIPLAILTGAAVNFVLRTLRIPL